MTGVIDGGWRILSSQRTTALLALLFAATAFVATIVPQGPEALLLAKEARAEALHELARWGLTDVFVSPFFYALAALLAGNLVAIAFSGFRAGAGAIAIEPPRVAPHVREVRAPFPERTIDALRETLIPRLGQPAAETVRGARVVMMFDSGPGAQLGPLAAHLGLMLLVLGAGLHVATEGEKSGLARARLEITDTRTKTLGQFDMAAGEPFQLFQWEARYVVREYAPSREGQGPAVRIERQPGEGEAPSDFWVYQNAPKGFDQRHRQGEVSIEAKWLGMSPLPGQGLADSPLGVLMLAGLSMIGIGTIKSRSAKGRIWIDTQGDVARIVGVPYAKDDPDFAAAFDRWARHTEAALAAD